MLPSALRSRLPGTSRILQGPMALDRFEIEGFRSIEKVDLEVRPLNVLIGANGAGKSNLIAAFGLLRDIVEERLQIAVARRGGASTLLRHGPQQTDAITLRLHFGQNGYEARLGWAEGDTLFFEKELCWFQGEGHPRPFDVGLGVGQRESRLATKAGDQGVANRVLTTLRAWAVYHFHDTSRTAKVKGKAKIGDNAALRADASNLAAFLYRLQKANAPAYRRIVASVRLVAPFFEDFVLRPDPLDEESIQLTWQEVGSDAYFDAHALSDGTLRFICLATLLLQPSPPSLVLLDEPELGLHPFAITQLAALLKSASTKTQLLVGTQSVTLVNQLDPEDVVVVDRKSGASTFRRITAEEIAAWTDEYALGDLWEKNLLGGRPQAASRKT